MGLVDATVYILKGDCIMVNVQRLKWIDALRALAMFFVVLGHLYSDSSIYFTLTGPIKMPLFYILAGYVMNTSKDWNRFFKGLLLRIFVPYIIFSFVLIKSLRYIISTDYTGLGVYLLDLFTGKILWFIPSFIIAQIVVMLLHKVCRDQNVILLLSAILFFVGYLTADIKQMDLWCINTAFTSVIYMNFGIYLKNHLLQWQTGENRLCITFASLYIIGILVSVIFYPGASMDVHSIIYYNIPICGFLIAVGAFLCINVSKKIKWNKALHYWTVFGQETLIVYLIHGNLLSALSKTLGIILPYNKASFVICLVYSVVICMIGTFISRACGKFIPEFVGKKRK